MFIIKIVILVALVKLLMATNKPLLCAGIYAGIGLLLGLGMGYPFFPLLLGSTIGFALAWVYFYLLDRTEGSSLWWVILIGGLLIGLV